MKFSKEKIDELRAKYIEACTAHKYYIYGEGAPNPRKANKNYFVMAGIRKELADDKEAYRELFMPLLKHEKDFIALSAAFSIIPLEPAKAKEIMEKIASGPDRRARSDAEIMMEYWRKGYYTNYTNQFMYRDKNLPVRCGISAEETIPVLRKRFIDAAIAYEYYSFGKEGWKPDEVSKSFEIMISIRQVMKVDKQAYRELFLPLLEHENDFVKKEAAYSLLPLEPEKAEKALEEVIDSGTKETGDSARKTRKLWKQGQYDELNSLFADDLLQS